MPAGATYEPIATTTGSGTSLVTFSSIPSTYTDLRLIVFASMTTGDTIDVNFNGTSGTSYSYTELTGNGTTAASTRATSYSKFLIPRLQVSGTGTTKFMSIFDIFSYAGITNKTCLITTSCDKNGSGSVERTVGLFRSTSAITSISLQTTNFYNYDSGSQFTLYGIKAA